MGPSDSVFFISKNRKSF